MSIRNKQLIYGLQQENIIKSTLEKYFSTNLIKSNTYDKYDFYCDDLYIEIKSRINILSSSYKSAFLSTRKVEWFKNKQDDKPYYYVANFIDKILVIQITDEIANYPVKKIFVKKRNEIEYVIDIPIKMFKVISNKCLIDF